MESGSPPPDRPGFGPGSPGYGPGGQPPPPPAGPQSPAPPDQQAPGGPQSPGPRDPQSPQPPPDGPQSPGPQSPDPQPDSPAPSPGGPQSPSPSGQPPSPPHAPPIGPETPQAPTYGGPVPPGGWQASPARQEGSPLGGPLAGWGARAGAYFVDGLIIFVPVTILFVVLLGSALGVTGSEDEDVAVGALILASIAWLILFAIIALVYAPGLMARKGARNGQTWGKQLFGIRAVRDSGEPYSFGSAAFREVVLKGLAVGIASSIIPIIPWFLNFFWPLWDDQNRALHDMAASSHVVKT